MWTAKTLIRLSRCPGWSESSLGAQVILLVLSYGEPFIDQEKDEDEELTEAAMSDSPTAMPQNIPSPVAVPPVQQAFTCDYPECNSVSRISRIYTEIISSPELKAQGELIV